MRSPEIQTKGMNWPSLRGEHPPESWAAAQAPDPHQDTLPPVFHRIARPNSPVPRGLVARDGIEPPTPAFSGPRSTI